MSDFIVTARQDSTEHSFNRAEKTILVVEDDRTQRTLMEKILRECEFQTVPAENGAIALSKIETQHFDLILMDWNMPELDGLETVRRIRAREAREDRERSVIIAFTANRLPEDREACLAAGMDAYLPKDVWMPRWRHTLIDNLQGLIAGDFNLADLNEPAYIEKTPKALSEMVFDLEEFDLEALDNSAALLKSELTVAIDEYLEDAASYIREIQSGLENNNAEMAAKGSHPLKSNSRSFGLITVSRIAEAINTITRSGSLAGVDQLLPQLQQAFHIAEKKLRDRLKRSR